jgi:RecA/RadA recombinase
MVTPETTAPSVTPGRPRNAIAAVMSRIRRGMPKKKENQDEIEINLASEIVLGAVHYILKTGLDPIDEIMGGVPMGRVIELYGLEACGKTELCKTICRQADAGEIYKRELNSDGRNYTLTRLDPNTYQISILYIDNEHSLEEDNTPGHWGVTRLAHVERMFKTIDDAMKGLDEEEKKTGLKQFMVVVIDTIAGTSSKEEMAQEWGKDDYARQPKQLREGFRNLIQDISRHNVAVICTNQVSDKFGYVEYGQKGHSALVNPDKYEAFGGKALKFWSTFRLWMQQLPNKYVLIPGAQFAAGYCIAFKGKKSRMKMPGREGRLVLLFDPEHGGFRNDFSKLETLIFLGFAEYDPGTKEFVFKFRKNGVLLTTFGDLGKSLEEMDAEAEAGKGKGRYKDPRIPNRAAWPKFYDEHKADFDALWTAAVAYCASTPGINGESSVNDDKDPDDLAEDAEPLTPEEAEAVSVPKRRGGRNPLKTIQV